MADTLISNELRTIFGDAFLSYVLNIDDQQDVSDVKLSDVQKQVVDFLAAYARTVMPQRGADVSSIGSRLSLAGLARYMPDQNASIVNVLRQGAGGTLPVVPKSGDELLDALLQAARDTWAEYLLPQPAEGPPTFWLSTSSVGFYQHPLLLTIARLMLADEGIGKFFPSQTGDDKRAPQDLHELSEYQTLVYLDSGGGGSLQLIGLISSIVSDAVLRTFLALGKLEWGALCTHMLQTLTDTRLLGSGKKIKAKTVVGLAGLRLQDNQQIQVGTFTLRAPREIEQQLFLKGAGVLTSVIETTTELKVLSITQHDLGPHHDKLWAKLVPRMEAAGRASQRHIDLLRFALLLASPTGEPWVATETARYVFNPTRPGGTQSWNPSLSSPLSFEVPKSSEQTIQDWHQTVTTKHVESLDVGMRRLLSATTSRTDAMDAFVDAVIVWENMFGAQTETTYRVTTAIASLLADSVTDRDKIYRELKKLYQDRSRLVHGGKEPPVSELLAAKDRAIEVATACFQKLYESRVDLIDLPSEQRGTRLAFE